MVWRSHNDDPGGVPARRQDRDSTGLPETVPAQGKEMHDIHIDVDDATDVAHEPLELGLGTRHVKDALLNSFAMAFEQVDNFASPSRIRHIVGNDRSHVCHLTGSYTTDVVAIERHTKNVARLKHIIGRKPHCASTGSAGNPGRFLMACEAVFGCGSGVFGAVGHRRTREFCAGEIRIGEVRVREVCVGEIRIGEVCAGEIRIREVCAGEFRSDGV